MIRAAFSCDGIALPPSVLLLSNTMIFGETGECIGVTPSEPPASRDGKLKLLTNLTPLESYHKRALTMNLHLMPVTYTLSVA